MALNLGKHKFTLQKKAVAFFGIVPLLLVTAWIPVPCPACHGSGAISSHGMAYVTLAEPPVVTTSGAPQKIYCDSWLLYKTGIILTLQNDGDQDASGFVVLRWTDPVSGYLSETQTVAISASAGKITQQRVSVVLTMPEAESSGTLPKVLVTIPDDRHPCDECNGSGKVMLNTWLSSKKRWELSNSQVVLGENTIDVPHEEDLEDWLWIPILDENDKPILDGNGFPLREYVEDHGGIWQDAVDENGNPMLDGNGNQIKIYIMNSFW